MKNNATEQELLDPGQGHEQHCGPVDAEPDATITWYKDGKPIREDEGNNEVIITPVRSCQVKLNIILARILTLTGHCILNIMYIVSN